MAQMTKDEETRQTWSNLAKTWLIFASDLQGKRMPFRRMGKAKAKRANDP